MAISVSGTTITFNDATTQTTAPVNTNANVTSLAAGTGISLSATTGAITITNSQPGAVSSVNGQTGAVVFTDAGSIGSIGVYMIATASDYAYGATIAGSNLRYNFSPNSSGGYGYTPFAGIRVTGGAYDGGGTSLSGTWRKMNTGSSYANPGCAQPTYQLALYVRVS